jgi:hypothetical protein
MRGARRVPSLDLPGLTTSEPAPSRSRSLAEAIRATAMAIL